MTTSTYIWQTGLLSQKLQIQKANKPAGSLQFSSLFSSTATAEIGGKRYTFFTYGTFNSFVEVHMDDGSKVKINKNFWSTSAQLDEGKWKWKANFSRSRWVWTDPDHRVAIQGFSDNMLGMDGKISIERSVKGIDSDLLLISGIYLHYYNYRVELLALLIVLLLIVI